MRTVEKLLFVALVLSLVWVGVSTAQLADSPWPMYGHDPQHTGRSPYNGPETPGTKWKLETGDKVDSSPAIGADGTVYVGSNDRNVYAIHPDGTLKWKYETGGGVRSSPAIGSDGTVYVVSYDHYLYAIHSDGSLKWRYEYEERAQWRSPSSPAIGPDGTVYVGSGDSHVHAIHPDGSLKWKYETMDAIWSCPAIGSDGTVYVGSFDRNVYAIHPDGTLKWKYKTVREVSSSAAIGSDGTVYIGPSDHVHDDHLYAIHPDGTLKWKYKGAGPGGVSFPSSPAIGSDGTIYVGSSMYNCVYAINSDGSLKWKYRTGGTISSCPAIGADGTIYVGSHDERLYAINSDGSLKWKYRTGGSILSSVAIGPNSTLYVGSQDGNIYAIVTGDEDIEAVPTTDLVICEEGPGDGWTIKVSSPAESDPQAGVVTHSGSSAHAITLERERKVGRVTYTFENAAGVDLFWYTHLSFWIYPGDADIQKLVVDIGGLIGRKGVKVDLVGDMGMELRGDRWIEVRIPLENLMGEDERMPFLKVSGKVTGTFHLDDMKLVVAVLPTTDLVIFGDGPVAGWTVKASSKTDSDPHAVATVHSGSSAHAITPEPSSFGLPAFMTYSADRVVHLYGYTHLVFWIYPGEADIQELHVDIGARDAENNLVRPDLVGDMGMELRGDRWIEVRIPLENLRGTKGRMEFLKLRGKVTGTFYVDDMKLELAEIEPTAVEESEGMVLPEGYALSQNYPNPFNPETTISYAVAKTGTVRLSVYTLTGQLVRTLMDGGRAAGTYSVTWDGTDDTGRDVASGVYLCRMEVGEYRAVRKMLLIR